MGGKRRVTKGNKSRRFAAAVSSEVEADARDYAARVQEIMDGRYSGQKDAEPDDEYSSMTDKELVKAQQALLHGIRWPVTANNRSFVRKKLREAAASAEVASRMFPVPEIADRDVRSVAAYLQIPASSSLPLMTLRVLIRLRTKGDSSGFWGMLSEPTFLVPKEADPAKVKETSENLKRKERVRGLVRRNSRAATRCDTNSLWNPMVEAYAPGIEKRMRTACANADADTGCMAEDGDVYPFRCSSALDVWLRTGSAEAAQVLRDHDIKFEESDRALYTEMYPKEEPDGPVMKLRSGFSGVWGADTNFSFQRLALLIMAMFLNKSDVALQIKEDGGEETHRHEHYRMVEDVCNAIIAPIIRALLAHPQHFRTALPATIRDNVNRYAAKSLADLQVDLYKFRDSTDLAPDFLDSTGIAGRLDAEANRGVAVSKVVAFLAVKDAIEAML